MSFDTLDGIVGFDPRDEAFRFLDLVDIDTPDGAYGFMPGVDGMFTDLAGKVWWGSTVVRLPSIQSAINGVAPAGSITMSFFQDPTQPDLVAKIKDLGPDYLHGRPISFYFQPIRSLSEFYAPQIAPQMWARRTMRTLITRATGAQDRSITVTFEAWSESRRSARRIKFDRKGHETLLGASNPSLDYRPTDNREDEKLFG